MQFALLLIANRKLILRSSKIVLLHISCPVISSLQPGHMTPRQFLFFQSVIHLVSHLTFLKWVAESLPAVCHSLLDWLQQATWGKLRTLSAIKHLQSSHILVLCNIKYQFGSFKVNSLPMSHSCVK